MELNTAFVDFYQPVPLSAVSRLGFFFPTGNPKPELSGSGKPDWIDRLPVETDQIQIWIQKTQFNRFGPVYQSVWPVYRPVWLVTGRFDW